MKRICYLLFVFMLFFFFSCKQEKYRLFTGGFTKPGEKGLSVFDFSDKGSLKLITQSDVGMNPTWFCYSDRNKFLYVANEVTDFNGTGGSLTTLRYNFADASLEKLNEMPVPYGGTCFISMSPDSGFLFLANYPKGSVVVVKLDQEGIPGLITDTILYMKDKPDSSHAHMIMRNPSGEKIYVSDLGLDRIMIYNFDKNKGKLIPADTIVVPKGSGPRHFVFNNEGSRLYVINELGSKMMVFNVEAGKKPVLIQSLSTFREGFAGSNYCADVHIGKDGRHIYGSNRGENSIVTFNIKDDGKLTLAGHTSCGGNWPRNFTIDPSGKYILVGNQKSDTIAVFRLNKTSGLPEEPSEKYKVTSPACLKFF